MVRAVLPDLVHQEVHQLTVRLARDGGHLGGRQERGRPGAGNIRREEGVGRGGLGPKSLCTQNGPIRFA